VIIDYYKYVLVGFDKKYIGCDEYEEAYFYVENNKKRRISYQPYIKTLYIVPGTEHGIRNVEMEKIETILKEKLKKS